MRIALTRKKQRGGNPFRRTSNQRQQNKSPEKNPFIEPEINTVKIENPIETKKIVEENKYDTPILSSIFSVITNKTNKLRQDVESYLYRQTTYNGFLMRSLLEIVTNIVSNYQKLKLHFAIVVRNKKIKAVKFIYDTDVSKNQVRDMSKLYRNILFDLDILLLKLEWYKSD